VRDNDALILRGNMSLAHGDPAAAISLMDELGQQYVRLGRPDDAIALYDGALAKNPKSYFAASNLAMLLVTYRSDSASLARARRLADQIAAMSPQMRYHLGMAQRRTADRRAEPGGGVALYTTLCRHGGCTRRAGAAQGGIGRLGRHSNQYITDAGLGAAWAIGGRRMTM